MSSFHIWTVGCQMNKADSGRIQGYLEQLGYQAAATVEQADIVVLNSCAVRQSAEDRVTRKLSALKAWKRNHPSALLIVTGCIVNSTVAELKQRFAWVDLFCEPQAFDDLSWFLTERGVASQQFAPDLALPKFMPPCAFVPIIQGCNNFCSFCIVPYRRGREKSRPASEIRCEVAALVRRGAREVTLLGQNVDSYGHDLPCGTDLAGLLGQLNDVEGLIRLRFLTSHPKDMSEGLIEAVSRLDRVCEHINLPLQSGDDDILKAMRRGYAAEHYRNLVARIRESIPGVALSTDIIVGFPGETEEQFLTTFDLLKELRFDTVHVAAYSPRPGTIASRTLEDNVPAEEKKRRRETVESLQEEIAIGINERLWGQTIEVLVEGRKKGKWWGRSRTDKLVFFSDGADRLGELVKVKIEKTGPWSLQGSLE